MTDDSANGESTMLYYDADGKRVSADSGKAVVQYLSDDPGRPDSSENKAAAKGVSVPVTPEAVSAPKK